MTKSSLLKPGSLLKFRTLFSTIETVETYIICDNGLRIEVNSIFELLFTKPFKEKPVLILSGPLFIKMKPGSNINQIYINKSYYQVLLSDNKICILREKDLAEMPILSY